MTGAETTTVRDELPAEIGAIREVNSTAFEQTQEADLVDTLRRNCSQLVSLAAITAVEVVGHILFSPARIEGGTSTVRGMALGPMAVRPDHQRQGVGSKLVRAGLGRMASQGCPFVIVLGHPEYYPRFGFDRASLRGVRCEWAVPDPAFMIIVLDESRMRGASGVARYRPEFMEVV